MNKRIFFVIFLTMTVFSDATHGEDRIVVIPLGAEVNIEAAVPDIPLRPVFRGYEESAFVNFLEQSHDGTGGWPRYGRPPAAG